MLINALCDYYDLLESAGKVLPDGYSDVNIHYIISLTPDGRMDGLIDCRRTEIIQSGKGKTKERRVPAEMRLFKRTEKPGIEANIAEHRPLYIFGLNPDGETGKLTPDDRTGKAKKSHEAFVSASLDFTEGLDSPVVLAFRNFLSRWDPQKEKENPFLTGLGKEYAKSGYAFCLSGSPGVLLHEDAQMKERWKKFSEKNGSAPEKVFSQCAVTGEMLPVARIHGKIKGIYGGLPTGNVLIGFNNPSENSYGKEQSFNSNISEQAMRRYTEALNYLLRSGKHRAVLDETTIVFWAMDPQEKCEEQFQNFLFWKSDQMDAEQTERMLKALLQDARTGKLTRERLSLDETDKNVDFYMLGLKPNSARVSVKFLVRKKYADILWNIVKFQEDLQVSGDGKPVSLSRLKMELVSPKSSTEKVNPALMAGVLDAAVSGGRFPASLLETAVRRVRTDGGRISPVKAGIIKACINRNYAKEELKMNYDKNENPGDAYLCGSLFAVLERLQQEASGFSLNRTIRDVYFSAAVGNPGRVLPKLITLSNYHLKKVKAPVYYEREIQGIISRMGVGFPGRLSLEDQGRFITGYYQRQAKFFEKKKDTDGQENSAG